MDISRRSFIELGGSVGAAAVMSPPQRWINNLVSIVNPLERIHPGIWYHYATTCRECPAGCGMLARHRDGRVVKCEGNPNHPLNYGGLCPRGQSAVQGLYDPDRIKKPQFLSGTKWVEYDWENSLNELSSLLKRHEGHVKLITGLQTGSLLNTMNQFLSAFGSTNPLIYEAFNYEYVRESNRIFFGKAVIPRYNFQNADLVVCLGTDFLETWVSNVEYTLELANGRTPQNNNYSITRMIYAGPRRSMTGANADQMLFTSAESLKFFGLALLKELQTANAVRDNADAVNAVLRKWNGVDLNKLSGLSKDDIKKSASLLISSKHPLIVAGSTVSRNETWAVDSALAAAFINSATGAYSSIIDLERPHALSSTATEQETEYFLQEIGHNDLLFIMGTNIVFTRPSSRAHLERAGSIVYMDTLMDETALLSNWVLPVDSPLESWGDYEPYRGIHSIIQPAMNRLLDTRLPGDILLELLYRTGKSATLQSFEHQLWDRWKILFEQNNKFANMESLRIDALQTGFLSESIQKVNVNKNIDAAAIEADLSGRFQIEQKRTDGELSLWLWPSILFFDGREANRDWLQETPDPVSSIVWDSWAEISAQTAKELKIDERDQIEIHSQAGSIPLTVHVTETIQNGSIAVMVGRGHTSPFLQTAFEKGANGFNLLTPNLKKQLFVTISKTGKSELLVTSIETSDQHDRDILKIVSLDKLQSKLFKIEDITWPLPKGYQTDSDLYPPHEYKKHRWAMIIDLQRCIGCQACAVACYAENNISVIGKDQVNMNRVMAWLKIVPYVIDKKSGRIAWLPLPCQQCDAAPCEPVCPVFASVHADNGINAQVYNRCIGTRDCMNNCPYRVRQFNWLNPKWRKPLNVQLNPEVTVRCRGVMEKCTFCIQRIREAEFKAKAEHRKIREGEVTPACVQSCPAKVFQFGDILDENSEIYKTITTEKRRYQVLRELNTKPAVIYLKKIIA